jgi:hypothetical protein
MVYSEALRPDSPEVEAVRNAYKELGLLTGVFGPYNKPGEVVPMHKHGSALIYVISGSVELRLEDAEPRLVGPGEEIIIEDQQGHELTVGPNGWLYLFGCDAAEAEAQGIRSELS